MLKNEFIEMMKQDLITKNNFVLNQMLKAFEEILVDYSEGIEIDNSKTIEDCFEKMKEDAQKKAISGSYCFGPNETREFIIKYLNLQNNELQTSFIDLEDFI